VRRQDIPLAWVEELLAETELRRAEYLRDGGEDTAYLDGKIVALEELLERSLVKQSV
jgi:hypothetical protein